MWNLSLGERSLSSRCLQLWARSPCRWESQPGAHGHGAGGQPGLSRGKAQLQLSAGGLEGIPSSAAHAHPLSIPLGSCRSFDLVQGAGALLRLPQPCHELCHNSPPWSCCCCPRGEGTASNGSWYREERDCEQWRAKRIQSMNPIRCGEFRQSLSKISYSRAFNFFIWPSVDNKLLGVNQDTVLNPFNGDSCLNRSKYHANQSLED